MAETDVAEAALWYEAQRPGLGREFVGEVEAVFQTLRREPERVRLLYPAQKVRRVLASRFPFHVYYYIEGQTVRIFAVVHAARPEREWKKRLLIGKPSLATPHAAASLPSLDVHFSVSTFPRSLC